MRALYKSNYSNEFYNKASERAQRSMDEYVRMVDDAQYMKQVANAVAVAFNRAHKTIPSRYFIPDDPDLPDRLECYDLPGMTPEEKRC